MDVATLEKNNVDFHSLTYCLHLGLLLHSPFFLAIERALDTSPGIPTLGKWLGITDPTKKSQQFFKLHQLQVT